MCVTCPRLPAIVSEVRPARVIRFSADACILAADACTRLAGGGGGAAVGSHSAGDGVSNVLMHSASTSRSFLSSGALLASARAMR